MPLLWVLVKTRGEERVSEIYRRVMYNTIVLPEFYKCENGSGS
jgi:hypothetical protein